MYSTFGALEVLFVPLFVSYHPLLSSFAISLLSFSIRLGFTVRLPWMRKKGTSGLGMLGDVLGDGLSQ